jgi:hypothetical protein
LYLGAFNRPKKPLPSDANARAGEDLHQIETIGSYPSPLGMFLGSERRQEAPNRRSIREHAQPTSIGGLNAPAEPADERSGHTLYRPHARQIWNHRRLIQRDERRASFGASFLYESKRLIEGHQLRSIEPRRLAVLDADCADGSWSPWVIRPRRIKADVNVHACSLP